MDSIGEDLLKLLVALVFGAIIGAEREYKTKSAGFRTVTLIMVGATLFTIVSGILGKNSDPGRIASNIVTGIGFIGAGAIFKDGNFVKGLTTAAVIWISAAIGMAIGVGQYKFAFLSLCIVMFVLIGFTWFQNIIDRTHVVRAYRITLLGHTNEKLEELNELFGKHKLIVKLITQGKRNTEMILNYSVTGSEKNHQELVKDFYSNSLIESFES